MAVSIRRFIIRGEVYFRRRVSRLFQSSITAIIASIVKYCTRDNFVFNVLNSHWKNGLSAILIGVLVTACSEHSGHSITSYRGDYSFDGDIGEFFDCEDRKKYFISKIGAYDEMKETYTSLDPKGKDDVYVRVKGYVKEEIVVEGLDPEKIFVVTELLHTNTNRGCELRQ